MARHGEREEMAPVSSPAPSAAPQITTPKSAAGFRRRIAGRYTVEAVWKAGGYIHFDDSMEARQESRREQIATSTPANPRPEADRKGIMKAPGPRI